MKTRNLTQIEKISGTIENSSQNKTDKTFSWGKKNNIFQNTILVYHVK